MQAAVRVGASGVREAVALGGERYPRLIRREPVDGDTLWCSVGKYSCGLSESSGWPYAGREEAGEERRARSFYGLREEIQRRQWENQAGKDMFVP